MESARTPRRRWPLVVVGIVVALVLAVGIFWPVYTNWSGPKREPRVPGQPVTVTQGAAFEIGGFSYQAGWNLQVVYGTLVVNELYATNTRERLYYPRIVLTFEHDSAVVTRTECSAGAIKPGRSVRLMCSPDVKPPVEYDKIVVRDGKAA